MSKRAILGLALVLLLTGLPAARAAPPAKPPQPVSAAALVPSGGNSPAATLDVTTITTDFEPLEGFPPGFSVGYCAQNGWTAFAASAVEGQISQANPSSGIQHLRISYDPAVAMGTNVGCFSPDIGAQPVQPSSMSIDVAVSGTGGADYLVAAQAPSQSFVTAYFRFYYLGDIVVMDDLGSGPTWVDTGANWTSGPYVSVGIDVNPGANTITYSYGGVPIYTGVVFAGTTIEQVVLFSDNYNVGDYGDFDNLQALNVNSVRVAGFESRPTVAWPIGAGLVAVLALGGVFGIFVKRVAGGG